MTTATPATLTDPTTPHERPLLTIPEVAERLRVSTRQVWRLIRDDDLETVRLGSRSVRVTEAQLADYIARAAERERDRW